jgi:hypothetical protein
MDQDITGNENARQREEKKSIARIELTAGREATARIDTAAISTPEHEL